MDTGISRSALRATNVRTERKQGSGTPTDAYPTSAPFRVRRAQSAARSPLGVPPRLSATGTIHPKAQPGPGFVTHQLTRRVPRQPVWHFQRCTSRAGHSAGRLMPRPPGSGSDEPPRAGTASRSAMRGHRTTSLYASEIDGPFSNLETRCQSVSICSNKSECCAASVKVVTRNFAHKDSHEDNLCQ